MDTLTTPPLQTLVVTPILEALAEAKQGDFSGAMIRLGVAPSTLAEAEFREKLMALNRALDLFIRSKSQEAAGEFQRSSALIDAIGLPDVRSYLAIMRDVSFGYASLQAADASGALKYFNSATDRSEKMGFTYSEVTDWIAEAQIGANIALFNNALYRGQMDEAEIRAGSILQLQRELEKRAADAGGVPPEMIMNFSATVVEVATTFAEQAMNALDYVSAKRRLRAAADAAARIAPNQAALPSVVNDTLLQTIAALFHLMNKLVEVAAVVVGEREPVSGETLQALDKVYDLLFEAERLAVQTGDRGDLKRAMIRRLHRLADNLTNIIRPQAGGIAARYAGPLFGLSLLVLMGVEYALVRPNAVVWPVMILGDLIAALIIAFGYGALQFKSLLVLYANVLGKAKEGTA